MSDKQLKEKAIKIKGKDYVMVKDRVIYLNDEYPKATVDTEAVFYESINTWAVKAKIYPVSGEPQYYNGHSQAVIGDGNINKTSALENAETSAVGRALAFMGIGVIDSIASGDEINKAKGSTGQSSKSDQPPKQVFDYDAMYASIAKKAAGNMDVGTIKTILSMTDYNTNTKVKDAGVEKILETLKGDK